MDPFAALLAKQNPSEAEGEVDSDPFNALLKRGAKPALAGKPGEIPTRAPGQPPGPTGGPAQPEAPEPTTLGRLIRGKGWLELGADVADIVVGGIPALVAGSYADLDQRTRALIAGKGWRAGGKAGAEASRQIGESIGRPIYDNLVSAGLIDPGNRSVPMQAMDKVGSFLERSAETFERDTGMPKEDYLSLVNGFMAAMGVKGTAAAVRHGVPGVKGLEARGKERAASAWDAALERFNAEEALARAAEAERQANRTTTPVKDARNARIFGQEQPQTDTRTVRQRRKDARDAFMSPEGEQLAASQVTYPDHHVPFVGPKKPPTLTPTGERTGSRDGVLLNLEGKETPTSQPGNQPFHTADTTAALKRGIVADTPIETEGRLASASRPSLDTAIEKVKGGRLFDLTPEERIALRGSREITDPKVITAAAVGATGLGLAMMYEPSPEEAAMAIGAGALLRRGGVGETMRELAAWPDTTPLGALLEPSAYTTSTLEKLADASPGRFEFKKAQVEQLLKRPEVTKHERGLMEAALASAPGDTITAKQLMVGVRTAAQDFELTPEVLDKSGFEWADYGLDRIDRKTDLENQYNVLPPIDELLVSNGRVVDLYGAILEDLPPGETLESWYAKKQAQDAGPSETLTRFYKLPAGVDLGPLEKAIDEVPGGHTYRPNSFGHTRSFVEDGIRHVVELQNNQAQYAEKAIKGTTRLSPEELEALRKRQLGVADLHRLWGSAEYGASRAGDYSFATALDKFEARGERLPESVFAKERKRLDYQLFTRIDGPEQGALVDTFAQEWLGKQSPETISQYERGYIDVSPGFSSWLRERAESMRPEAKRELRNLIQRLASARKAELAAAQDQLRGTLRKQQALDNYERISPMLKDWHKRLIREELADAARNLEGSVRFATADTVAKVEGWPDVHERITDSIAQNESNLASHKQAVAALEAIKRGEVPDDPYYYGLRTADPEGFRSVVENIETELTYAREALAASEERLARAKENLAGQTRFSPEHQGIYDRYSRDVEKFLRQLGGQPYTDQHGHTWIEVPLGEQQKALPGGGARTQMGGADPALLKGVAAVGGTAALAWMLSADKDKARHAAMAGVLTGLGLLLKSRVPAIAAMVQKTVNGIQAVGGNLSTDRALTEPLLRRLTEHARAELKGIHDAGRAVAPFLEIASRLPASVQKDLNVALMNGSSSGIVAAVGRAAAPGLLKEWNNVQAQLKKFAGELQSVGLLETPRPDYFPRIVKDLPGLLNAIGKDYAVPLQRALDAAEKKAGMPLDEAERAAIVNKFIEKNLRGQTGEGKASFFKRRTIDNVSIDLEPFYVEPLQALPLYIGSATRAIERARFFGKDAVRDPVTGKLDLSNSIGNVAAKEVDAGNLTQENYTRLTKLLKTRFGPAYGAPDRPFQALGQFTNIALLGNVFSGMMNLADIGTIAAQHGVVPLAAALAAKVGKRQKITAADVGMAEHIMEEFVYGTREPVKMRVPLTERTVQISLAKALDKTFKYSGFKFFDQVMKEVALNAAFEKYSRLSRTKSGEARIMRQYSDYFTSDMPQLLADLRAGAKTKLTTELAFRELSDAQPVTKIEMPQFYLDHPNLRFGFALKSFMIKQINLIKRRGVREIERGNFREGVGFLTRYALMAGAAGATMDWVVKSLLGRDADTDWSTIPFNALKNFGLSEYVIDKMRQGKGKEALLAATTPPVDPILKILSADPEAVRYFPLIGRLFYDRAMDGAEKANAAKRLAEKRKKRDAERTDEDRALLRERAIERRKRLLEQP